VSASAPPSALRGVMTRQRLLDRTMRVLCAMSFLVVMVPLIAVLVYAAREGLSSLRWSIFTTLPDPTAANGGGLLNAIMGTLLLIGIACVVGISIGLFSGIYLAEFGDNQVGTTVRFLTDVLAGLPSIVAGLVAYGLIVVTTGGFSALSGGVALGLLMFPTVTRTTESVLRLVPDDLREAGLALGVPQWRVIISIALPTAASGVATAVILGIARIAGETAPLLFTAFGSNSLPSGFMQPVSALPLSIWINSQAPDDQSHALAWAGALILVMLVLLLNLLARLVARRFGGLRQTSM
jgi:phosphate transport system permease protein